MTTNSVESWEPPVFEAGLASEPVAISRLEQIQEAAYKEGYEAGHRDGYRDGDVKGFSDGSSRGHEAREQVLTNAIETLEALCNALSEPLCIVDEQIEDDLVALSVTIAKQLVRRELKSNPQQIVSAVREALGALGHAAQHRHIHVHPDDEIILKEHLGEPQGTARWSLVADPIITRGGCRVDTEVSMVDATVESRLSAIIAAVLGGERSSDEPSNTGDTDIDDLEADTSETIND